MKTLVTKEQEMTNDDFVPDGQTLLKNQGVIRGDCMGQIQEAPPNQHAVAITDPRKYSSEPYTPFPCTDKEFPKPEVKPVVTPPESYTK